MSFDRSRFSQQRSADPADAAREVIRQLVAHRSAAAGEASAPPLAVEDHLAYQAAIRRVLARLPEQAARVEAHFFTARAELERLLQTDPRQRSELVARAPRGFRGPVLVDLLIQHSHRLLGWNLDEALDLARWAAAVAERPEEGAGRADVAATAVARARAHLGNALRKQGRLEEAEPMLEGALEAFDRAGTGDVLVEGEILELTALLRIAQRRLAEAEALVSMALSLYEECEAFERVGPALAEKAAALAEIGELPDAIDTLEEALAQLELEHQPEVSAWTLQNQTFYLLRARLPVDAAEVLRALEVKARGAAAPWLEARQCWLELEIVRQAGHREEVAEKRQAAELALKRLGVVPGMGSGETPHQALGLGLPWNGGDLPHLETVPAARAAGR